MVLEKEKKMTHALLRTKSLFIYVFIFALIFVSAPYLSQSSETEVYNFIKKAPYAKWERNNTSAGRLPFNGPNTDKRGYVRYLNGAVLENGKKYTTSVLQTHPEWKKNGRIHGYYEGVKIPPNAKFKAKVGFVKGAKGTDGVTLEVVVYDPARKGGKVVVKKKVIYNNRLDQLTADLSSYANKTQTIILQVSAGNSSAKDGVVWSEAKIVATPVIATMARATAQTPDTVQKTAKMQAVIQPGKYKLAKMKAVQLRPVGTPPPKHDVTYLGPIEVEEPIVLSEHIYRDNKNRNLFYFLPKEINLVRGKDQGSYKISAVWTQDKKIKATLILSANIDPSDVKILEEAVRKKYGRRAVLRPLPYDEANIIDMEGWGDWQIEDIRIPTFGSLEGEMPVNITMTPESLAELKPLLEKEGLTAGMHIKSAAVEKEIPIKIGLRYFVGRFHSPLDEVNFSFNNKDSTLTIHNVKNYSDFPLKIDNVNLRFQFQKGSEIYRALRCDPEVIIPPGEEGTIKVLLAPQPILKDELKEALGEEVKEQKKKSLLDQALDIVKEEAEEIAKKEAKERVGVDIPEGGEYIDPKVNQFFKDNMKSYWLEIFPDFDCQECLDIIWEKVEVVSYIERMRKINIEVLENVFDPSQYETSIEIEKIHIEIKSPYLSPQPKEGLITSVDLTKDKLQDAILVYLPLSDQEPLEFYYKIKAVTKTGEYGESVDWEFISDSLDLTIGVFHVADLFK